jgi:uncharacterized membrane protein YukC
MGKRKRRRGHFCWSCRGVLPNERFSGRGHARHVCKQCQKLGPEELAYRSAARNMERLLNWDRTIRRKRRQEFERFLQHSNPRVRRYAEELSECDASRRREIREEREAEEDCLERIEDTVWQEEMDPNKAEPALFEDEDLPF